MKRVLALALCTPVIAFSAPASATTTLPTSVKVSDTTGDVTLIVGASQIDNVTHDFDIFEVTAMGGDDSVEFTMTINNLTKQGITGKYTENGKKVPIGYFSFLVRLDGEKHASLAVGRYDGEIAVFPVGEDNPDAIDCDPVTLTYSTAKDWVRYTVPTECLGNAEKAQIQGMDARVDSGSYAYDQTKYTKAFQIG